MIVHLSKIKVVVGSGRPLFSIRDLKIPQGSHLLIQGASGRGKTTLLHLIAGLFHPLEGEVQVGDQILGKLNDDARCDLRKSTIGLVFQKLNLIDHMTVEENVRLSLPNPKDQTAIDEALAKVNLIGRNHERCAHMSVGEQQRVAIARVLAQRPQIILADEPTSSLDDVNGQAVLEALKLAAKEKTLIVVSHDHRLTSKFDRVIQFEELIR